MRRGAVGYAGVSMGCRLGVPFVALDERVRAAAFFVGGSGEYSRWELEGTEHADLALDAQSIVDLTDPGTFAPMTAGRPTFMVNGKRDMLVGLEAGERLQRALGEPKTLRWFDGDHAETPGELFEEALQFLALHLQPAS